MDEVECNLSTSVVIPRFIRTTSDFHSVVKLKDTSESVVLEFKRMIPHWPHLKKLPEEERKDVQRELCRDVAQFSNTYGGCLLIGVSEKEDVLKGVRVAEAIYDVPKPDQLKQWLEDSIFRYLVPTTFDRDIALIELSDGVICAINIPASRHTVSLWDKERGTVEYVRRTDHGKKAMNPDEAERHRMSSTRAMRLAMLAAKTAARSDEVEIAGGLWFRPSISVHVQRHASSVPSLVCLNEYTFEITLPFATSTKYRLVIPYGVVREAWVTADGRVGLLLDVRVVLDERSNRVILEND